MARVRVVALTLSVAAALVVAGSVLAANASVRITEANNKYSFGPAKVFINVGQKVTWTNGSDAPHTVTSDSGTELASSNINAGKTFSHTFSATGSFPYHCSIHTYMKGTVVVLAAGATPPPTDTVEATPAGSPTSPAGMLSVLALGVGVIVARQYLRHRKV
jgi:plastocyanin